MNKKGNIILWTSIVVAMIVVGLGIGVGARYFSQKLNKSSQAENSESVNGGIGLANKIAVDLNGKTAYFFSVDVLNNNKTSITDTFDIFFNNELISRHSIFEIQSSTTISSGFYSTKKQSGNLFFVQNASSTVGSLIFNNPKITKEVPIPEDVSCYLSRGGAETVEKVYNIEPVKFTLQGSQYKWVTSKGGDNSVIFDQGEAILNTSKGKMAVLTTQMALPIDTLYFEFELKGTNVSSNDQFNVYWDNELLIYYSGEAFYDYSNYMQLGPTDLQSHAGTNGNLTFVFIGNKSDASVNIKNFNISYGIGHVACVGVPPVKFTPVQF